LGKVRVKKLVTSPTGQDYEGHQERFVVALDQKDFFTGMMLPHELGVLQAESARAHS